MLIRLESIGRRKTDGARDEWLVSNVSFDVNQGERIGLTGPSGAGKTVLLRLMALLDEPDSGRLTWRGKTVSNSQVPDYRRQVIYLHQRPHFIEGTVQDNLRLPLNFQVNVHRQMADFDETAFLRQAGRSSDFLQRNVSELSGGEAQVVALARAMQLQPNVLLLDEPTASADMDMTLAIERTILQWQSENSERAFLFVSHTPEQIQRIAHRRLHLVNGQLQDTS